MDPNPTLPTHKINWLGGWPQSKDEFARFVDMYLTWLVKYAYRRLYNIHDAEDVVQDVFVQAYKRREQLAQVTLPGAYLYKMTANACVSHIRKRKRVETLEKEFQKETDTNNTLDPLKITETIEEIEQAEQIIKCLPDKQAEVVRMRVFDELQLNEIAEVIGCSLNTVGSRLRYGFKKLREIISHKRSL